MTANKFLLTLSIIILAFPITAQLHLIPTPQLIEQEKGVFELKENISLISNFPATPQNRQFVKWFKKATGFEFSSTPRFKKNNIQLTLIPSDEEFTTFVIDGGLDETFLPGEEGYLLKITQKSIQIAAQTQAGIYYGMQTLKQMITANADGNEIPCVTIYDYPDFPVRAWQDDISRGPIPTMDMLKQQIEKMAAFKLNHFTLYTEHTFKLDKHPGIAPQDGITKEELNELKRFARKHHVTLIGNYQSFGHMEETLSHPDYQHLAENDHIISPALEASYEFLNDVYEEIVPVYDGEYFNINCDETFGLGEGKSKSMVDSMGVDGVYIYHINRLNDLLKPYGKSILMWGDIAANHPKIVKELPEDITVIAWAYHNADNFDGVIKPVTATGLDFWVAPGVNCWQNVYPNLEVAEINIFNFVRDGKKHNASGVLNTTWDDDGFNLFQNNWHGLSWGAEVSWKAPDPFLSKKESEKEREKRYQHFNFSFDKIFYGLEKISMTYPMRGFSMFNRGGVKNIFLNQRFFEPVFPIHAEYVQDDKKASYLKQLDQLKATYKITNDSAGDVLQNKEGIDNLLFAIKQVQFTLRKNLLRKDVYDFMNKKGEISASQLKAGIHNLAEEAKDLKSTYKQLWLKENRNWWLDVNMKKYDELIQGIKNLEGYCYINTYNDPADAERKISLQPLFEGMPVYYEFGDKAVTTKSKKYTRPIALNKDIKIVARVIHNGKSFPVTQDSFSYHLAIGKLAKLNATPSNYHPSYDGGGEMALLDGKQGESKDLRSGRWQGFSGEDIDLEIDLGKKRTLNEFSMGCYQNTHTWVILPKSVKIYYKTSDDGDYQLFKTINHSISPKESGSIKHYFEADLDNLKAQYLKIVAEWYGKLPEWHHAGSKYDSMLFADEIIIR